MGTRYLGLMLQHEPLPVGVDTRDRPQYEVLFNALKRPSATFLEEVLHELESAGVGTRAVDLFAGEDVALPDGAGPFILALAGAGLAPVGTHNEGAGAYRRPGLRLLVSARTSGNAAGSARALAMAERAISALLRVRNKGVSA
jgi:hypothetical protein